MMMSLGQLTGRPAIAPSGHEGIRIEAVRKVFAYGRDEIVALDDVTLTVAAGEFLCIVGPSGCGKTTLLRILAGLDDATSGTVRWSISDRRGPAALHGLPEPRACSPG